MENFANMLVRTVFLGVVFLGCGMSGFTQNPTYRNPLDIPIVLSGNFGELRSSHFHSGLDIKTNGQEGLNVYAVEDGYVSRIRVSPSGYGKALYIDHPDGNTTVYGHLSAYSDSIARYVLESQYRLESFSIDVYPGPGTLPVSKGQLIAKSGNSGSSGGPHLHFEVRETRSELALNPLAFGFSVADKQSPEINGIRIYPIGDSSSVQGSASEQQFLTEVISGNCKLKHTSPIRINGKAGFAIHTNDRFSGGSNICGVYKVRMVVDNVLIYEHVFDKLSFDQRRNLHGHRDYRIWRADKRDFQRTFALPNQDLVIYNQLKDRGVVAFSPGDHKVRFESLDYAGNTSVLEFSVKSDTPAPVPKRATISGDRSGSGVYYARFDKDLEIETGELHATIPALSLFEDAHIVAGVVPGSGSNFGSQYEVGDPNIPLLAPITVRIRVDSLPKQPQKLLLARKDPSSGKVSAIKASFVNGWLQGESADFGIFYALIDTIAPSIKPYDFRKELKGKKSFTFKISDNFSGIESANGWIDGKWILMDFDAKTASLTYVFDKTRVLPGNHKLVVKVRDERGNEAVYENSFTW